MRYKCNTIRLRFNDGKLQTLEGDFDVKFADTALVITSYKFDAQRNIKEIDSVRFISFPEDVIAFMLS